MRKHAPGFEVWALVTAILTAISVAFAAPPPGPKAPAASTTSAPAGAGSATLAGLAPLPGGQQVPSKLLPPGSTEPDPGPSPVIFPTQRVTIRFNHKFHISEQHATCKTCHPGAFTSQSIGDHLTPPGTVCDSCHMSDHGNLQKVSPGDDDSGQCSFCHVGYRKEDGNRVAALELPRANMIFNHRAHATRNIGCQQCHGAVQELELATRDQLPRMPGCFTCHQMPDAAARGDARSACITCHIRATAGEKVGTQTPGLAGGSIRTVFAAGVLKPPRWLNNAAHTPDFIERHKMVAAADSQFCSNCHKEDFCTDCHDGRVRPRSIHPSDYISMHPIEARMATERCTSCHREQSFCLDCHMRVGVSMSSPPGARDSGRFHPPKSIWSDPPRQAGHHSFEAERNLNACVSCHIQRDCVVCHGGQGIGGGFNPHRAGFATGCSTQYRRNPRPCLVCHDPAAPQLAMCR
jgi:hypothetical protein